LEIEAIDTAVDFGAMVIRLNGIVATIAPRDIAELASVKTMHTTVIQMLTVMYRILNATKRKPTDEMLKQLIKDPHFL
jgi:hypothetical protein